MRVKLCVVLIFASVTAVLFGANAPSVVVRLRFLPFGDTLVACSLVEAPAIGRVGSSLEGGAVVGMGVELMRVSMEEEARMSDMRFGGIVG